MDKFDKVRTLEALGVKCEKWGPNWHAFAPWGWCELEQVNESTKWRLWLLDEMERRGWHHRLIQEAVATKGQGGALSIAYAFAKLSNEDLMRAALSVLEESA